MKTNWKTNLIGGLGIAYLVGGVTLVYLDAFTIGEFAESLALVAVFLTSILAFFSKDNDK